MGIYFVQEHFGVRVCSKLIPLYDVKINTIDIKVVAMIMIMTIIIIIIISHCFPRRSTY